MKPMTLGDGLKWWLPEEMNRRVGDGSEADQLGEDACPCVGIPGVGGVCGEDEDHGPQEWPRGGGARVARR